jgi:hypothetical protein
MRRYEPERNLPVGSMAEPRPVLGASCPSPGAERAGPAGASSLERGDVAAATSEPPDPLPANMAKVASTVYGRGIERCQHLRGSNAHPGVLVSGVGVRLGWQALTLHP